MLALSKLLLLIRAAQMRRGLRSQVLVCLVWVLHSVAKEWERRNRKMWGGGGGGGAVWSRQPLVMHAKMEFLRFSEAKVWIFFRL